MDPFIQKYIEVFTPAMEELGFSRKRKIFHRLFNDKIVQMLSYRKPSGGRAFTIQFELCALCEGYGYSDIFMDSIQSVDRLMSPPRDEWEYLNDEYTTQLPEALECCKELVFPIFARINDYESYFDYEKKIHTYDGKVRWDYLPSSIYLMKGEYEIALDQLKSAVTFKEEFLSGFIESELEKKWALEMKEEIRQYKAYILAIEARDIVGIEKLIKEAEEYSRQSYIQNYFGGQKKYEKWLATKNA